MLCKNNHQPINFLYGIDCPLCMEKRAHDFTMRMLLKLEAEVFKSTIPQHELPGQPRIQRVDSGAWDGTREADKIIGDEHIISDYVAAKGR